MLTGLVFGLVSAPAAKATNACEWAGSLAKGNVARVDLAGSPFNGNKGFATNMDVYNVQLQLVANSNFSLFHMYASTGSTLETLGNYLEFGWYRERIGATYYATKWDVVLNGNPTPIAEGSIAAGANYRFKMYYEFTSGTGKWRFKINDVLKYTYYVVPGDPTTNAYLWSTSEVRDSCNGAQQAHHDAWRWSTSSGSWYELGTGPSPSNQVAYHVLPNYDTNNHHAGDAPTASHFDTYCDYAGGCQEFQ